MAKWQYSTLRTKLNRNVDFDEELQKILQDYGMQGWELVQVLEPKADGRCHLLFKRQKQLFPYLEPATH